MTSRDTEPMPLTDAEVEAQFESSDAYPWAGIATTLVINKSEILALCSFLAGYISHIRWLMFLGGLIVVLQDLFGIALGALQPLFPVLLAVVLACILTPSYTG